MRRNCLCGSKTGEWFVLSSGQIESKKLDWNVTSKVGSLDNAQHKPGGGEKKVSDNNCQ